VALVANLVVLVTPVIVDSVAIQVTPGSVESLAPVASLANQALAVCLVIPDSAVSAGFLAYQANLEFLASLAPLVLAAQVASLASLANLANQD
jgi:CO dehydrogenase/acetyl-CoA synthase gamma subunit (corrinoid Fe-S protein)